MKLADARTYLFLGGILIGIGLVGYAQNYMALESLRDAFRRIPTETLQAIRDTLRKQEWT